MKTVGALILCGCAVLLSGAAQAQASAPLLDWRLRFQAGQEVHVRRESYNSATFLFAGQKMAMKSSATLIYSLQVLDVGADGTARARLRLLSFGFRGDGGRTFYGPYSSLRSGADEALRPLRLAAKSSLEMSIGPHGEVDWEGENWEEHKDDRRYHARDAQGRLLGPEEQERRQQKTQAEQTLYAVAEDLRLLLAYLPQEPIQEGQRWRRQVSAHSTRPTQLYPLDSTLLSADAQSLTLKISQKLVSHPPFSGTVQSNGIGQIEIDASTGWPRRAQLDGRSLQRIDTDGDHSTSYSKQHSVFTFSLIQAPAPLP